MWKETPSNGISFCKAYALQIILGNRPVEFRLRNITYPWGSPPCSSGILITSFWVPSSTSPRESKFSSVQFLSHVRLFATPWTAARKASLSITNARNLPKCMNIESVMPSNHLILGHALLLLPSIFPSIRVFSSESVLCIRWPEYWSFSISISPSNEYWGLISFRMDWLDLLAVQGTLKSLLQHHSSKSAQLSLWSNSRIHTWLLEKP